MRIETHPILENFEKGRLVHFTFDGKDMIGYEGEPIAEALRAADILLSVMSQEACFALSEDVRIALWS